MTRAVAAGALAIVLSIVVAAPAAAWPTTPARTPTTNGIELPFPNPISGFAGDALNATASVVLDAVDSWITAGAEAVINSLADVINQETNPDVAAQWMHGNELTMARIAALLAVPFLLGAAFTALLRQDPSVLLRAVFVHLPLAAVGTTIATFVVTEALAATDELCAIVSTNDVQVLFSSLASRLHAVPGADGFAGVIVSLIVAAGAFLLTLELIVREAAIYVAMLFLPLALAGMVWPATMRWSRRLGETLGALILSKFVIVAIISLAVSAVATGVHDSLSALIAGAALLLLAATAPMLLLRMVPIVEASVVSQVEGGSARLTAPVHSAEQGVHRALLTAAAHGAAGGSGGGGGSLPLYTPNRAVDPDGTLSGAGKPALAGRER